ncbi:MAG: DUF5011 domain-containing protein [Oscillospiraceae bacterium]|nr:DUF5011 domain-containing protein [Oscillospiraceae bacterium]
MKKFLFVIAACLLASAVIFVGITSRRPQPPGISQAPTVAPTAAPTVAPTTAPTVAPTLSLTLNGGKEIRLEYGQDYTESGAKALFTKDEVETEVPVEILGQVDTTRVGEYVLTYTAEAEGLAVTDSRRVCVVDTQNPVITLTENPDSWTLLGKTYEEEGFRATDNYDGDITDKVIRVDMDGVVTYTVTDSSGNTVTVKRTINYFDPGRPNLRLQGDSIILLAQGDTYKDPGATATDQTDGDLSARICVDGEVDTAVSGIYTLQYNATNSYGFSSSISRTVYVLPMKYLLKSEKTAATGKSAYPKDCIIPQGGMAYKPTGKTIYLTFDDGPTKHTGKLLDTLARYDIKASFFVIHSSYIDMIARAAREGHTVGIHAHTHNYSLVYASDEAFLADFQAMQQVIAQQTGQITMLSRFPGGGSNTVSRYYNKGIMTRLTKKLTEMGYTYFDWNVDSDDAGKAKTSEEVFKNITDSVRWYNNSVVLQHDSKEYSVDAVERLIVWGLVNGYTFKPLTADSPTCHHPVLN